MSPPRHISYSLLLPTTDLQLNMSSKPYKAYPIIGHHVPTSPLYYTLPLSTTSPQVNTSSKPSKPYQYYRSKCNVPTSPYLLFSTTTYYRSTGQHVVKTFKTIPVLQVNMSPPRHISYSLLRPTTGQHVVKPLRIILYCRSTCLHLATSLILYYHQQEVYMSTHCQNPHNHTITTGHHVPTSQNPLIWSANNLQVNTSSKHSEQ